MNEAAKPGRCDHQIVTPPKEVRYIGGSTFVQPILCVLKCAFDTRGNYVPTLGNGCSFKGNERSCPDYQEAK